MVEYIFCLTFAHKPQYFDDENLIQQAINYFNYM